MYAPINLRFTINNWVRTGIKFMGADWRSGERRGL